MGGDAAWQESRGRPLEWPTDEPWTGAAPPRPQDPWATGSPCTRAQVESIIERERQKRRERPWLKPLAEGPVEDVMLQLAKDKVASDRVRRNYDPMMPMALYLFSAGRDGHACERCRRLDGMAWNPWEWRPPYRSTPDAGAAMGASGIPASALSPVAGAPTRRIFLAAVPPCAARLAGPTSQPAWAVRGRGDCLW